LKHQLNGNHVLGVLSVKPISRFHLIYSHRPQWPTWSLRIWLGHHSTF